MTRRLLLLLSCVVFSAVASTGARQTVRSSQTIDAAQLLSDLRTLTDDEMQGRQVGTPGGARARAFIIDRFKSTGVKPFGASYEQPFTFPGRVGRRGAPGGAGTTGAPAPVPDVQGVNVIGQIEGTARPAQYIVISAHYDHEGVRNGVVFNGADDNASGTAALFALATYFSTHRPTHSLIFAALDGEEAGLQGSKAFVKTPPVPAASIIVNVNMDMIGRDPNDKLFVVGTRINPFLKPFLEPVAKAAPVKLLFGHEDPAGQRNTESEDWSRQSDHYSFQQAGIPAIYIGVEDFAQHHQPTDDYETMTHSFYIGAVETSIMVVQAFDRNLPAIAKARAVK
jgi:Zn-dependent M28 family amino/carboxypeptidase